jgi:hypothetical protein
LLRFARNDADGSTPTSSRTTKGFARDVGGWRHLGHALRLRDHAKGVGDIARIAGRESIIQKPGLRFLRCQITLWRKHLGFNHHQSPD